MSASDACCFRHVHVPRACAPPATHLTRHRRRDWHRATQSALHCCSAGVGAHTLWKVDGTAREVGLQAVHGGVAAVAPTAEHAGASRERIRLVVVLVLPQVCGRRARQRIERYTFDMIESREDRLTELAEAPRKGVHVLDEIAQLRPTRRLTAGKELVCAVRACGRRAHTAAQPILGGGAGERRGRRGGRSGRIWPERRVRQRQRASAAFLEHGKRRVFLARCEMAHHPDDRESVRAS